MAIFEFNFSDLFIKKHGYNVYIKIKKIMTEEVREELLNDYIVMVFNIAYAKYIGIHENRIADFIKDILGGEEISNSAVKNILEKHQQSIKEILKYIKSTEKEIR